MELQPWDILEDSVYHFFVLGLLVIPFIFVYFNYFEFDLVQNIYIMHIVAMND